MAEAFVTSAGEIVVPSRPTRMGDYGILATPRLAKRICRPDGSVTHVHESCGFRFEMTFAGGRGAGAS